VAQIPAGISNGHGLAIDRKNNIYFTFQSSPVTANTRALTRYAFDGTDPVELGLPGPSGLSMVRSLVLSFSLLSLLSLLSFSSLLLSSLLFSSLSLFSLFSPLLFSLSLLSLLSSLSLSLALSLSLYLYIYIKKGWNYICGVRMV